MGSNTAEISLDGLTSQIKNVQNSIDALSQSFGNFENKFNKNQTEQMTRLFETIQSQVLATSDSFKTLIDGSKSLSAMKAPLSALIDVFTRFGTLSNTFKGKVLINTDFSEGLETSKNYLEKVMNAMERFKSQLNETKVQAKMSFKAVYDEFSRLSALKMPKAVDMNAIMNAEVAKNNIDSAIQKLSFLARELKAARKMMKETGDARMPRVVGDLKKQVMEAGAQVKEMNNQIKEGEQPLLKYKEVISDVVLMYDDINNHVRLLAELENEAASAGKSGLSEKYRKQREALESMIAPYQKMVEYANKQREAYNKAYGDINKTKERLELRNEKEREYLELVKKLSQEQISHDNFLQQAEKLTAERLELTKQLVSIQKQAEGAKDLSTLGRMAGEAASLEDRLAIVQNSLNAIFKEYPMVQQAINASINGSKQPVRGTDGSITSQIVGANKEAQNLEKTYNNITKTTGSVSKNLESQANTIGLIVAKEQDRARTAQNDLRIQRQSMSEYEKLMNRLVSRGNISVINSYLKQEMSIQRMNTALQGLRSAQERCNVATRKGAEEYMRYEAHINKIQSTLNRLNGEQSAFSKIWGGLKNTASQVAMSFGVMAGVFGTTQLFRSMYKITSEFQLQQRALEAIIQNAREANVLFKQMQNLAVTSPMKFMDLNRYAKQLAAFRIETNEIYNSLKMLGDISVGVGVDMDRLILAYGQVKAANYLRGQELRQFSEAGVNILGGLQQYYQEVKGISMTINEIFDSVSKRKVLFEDVDAVLKRMTESGGAFYNMQLIQSQTLYGQMQKVGDLFQIQMNEVGSSYSGILIGIVKLVQIFVKNLRAVVSIIASIAAGKSIASFVSKLQQGALVSKELAAGLALCKTQATLLSKAGWKELIANIRTVTSLSAGLRAGLIGLGAGLSIFALTAIVGSIQNHKQRIKELNDEILELNNRLKDTMEIDRDFAKATTYKEKLIAFQKLVEKAKEYGYVLQFAEKDSKNIARITPKNIDSAFKDATEQLKNYTKQVEYYKSAFSDKSLERRLNRLNNLAGEYANAQGAAEELYKHYVLTRSSLSKQEQAIIAELMQMEVDYQKDSNAAAEKYGKDRLAYEKYRVEQIAKIRKYATVVDVSYSGKETYAYDKNSPYGDLLKTVDDFESEYQTKLNSAAARIKTLIDNTSASLKFKGKTGAALERAIIAEFPPLIDAFKELGDFAKEDIIKILSDALEQDYTTVVRTLIKYQNGTSDIGDPEFKKTMEQIFGKDSVIKKEVVVKITDIQYPNGMTNPDGSFNPFAQASARVGNAVLPQTTEAIKKTLSKSTEEISNEIDSKLKSGKTVEEVKKDMDDMVESTRAALKQYKAVGKNGADLSSVNAQNAMSFETAADGVKWYTEALRKLGVVYKTNAWDLPKIKGGGRADSKKQQYQSMIDIIVKLNSSFEDLRNNFAEADTTDFMGALNRVIYASEDEFDAMIQSFKDEFGSVGEIQFTTLEKTVDELHRVRGIIEQAGPDGLGILSQKEVDELIRTLENKVWDLRKKIEEEKKKLFDESLKSSVQKMFDDYELNLEVGKLGVDESAVKKLFNITAMSLSELQKNLEAKKDEFMGRNMEKEYRQFMRKIVEINDKANLEMAKNYAKYLREEFSERAKLELEYIQKRADIYALPFDEEQQSRVIENIQKETKEKLDKLEWDEFRGSDYYVEMFEDLGRVSTQALQGMIDKLGEMRGKLSELSPTEYKTLVEQMQKITDELVRRNPFKYFVDATKELAGMRKKNSVGGLIDIVLPSDEKTASFSKNLSKALDTARRKLLDLQKQLGEAEADLKTKMDFESLSKELPEGVDWGDVYNLDNLRTIKEKLESEMATLRETINAEGVGVGEPTKNQKRSVVLQEQINFVSKMISLSERLGKKLTVGSGTMQLDINELKRTIGIYNDYVEEMNDAKQKIKEQQEAIKKLGEDWQDAMGKVKTTFDTVFDNLDYLGGTTDGVTEAWKELGDTIFDTVIQSIGLIAQFSAAAVAGETAINAAAGWIGLIAEAVTLIVTGISQIFKIKDAKIAKEMETIQKNMDKLKKTAEDLKGVFDNLFNEEELRAYDAAIIRTKELYIEQLEAMIRSEESKKKSDKAAIDGWRDEIESTYDEIREQTEAFYNSVGGLGGQSEMKAQAEEWTNAWYEAFKETGDGLQGLEDSFDSFLDEIFKKQILNQLSSKYFKDLFEKLNTILGTGGGLQSNIDDFTEWVDDVHEQFGRFSEEAQQLAEIFYGAGGLGGGLEGLQASIQGMTEQTAELLAAYLNSIRFYVSDNSEQIAALTEALTVDNGTNPIIEQLKVIAQQTTSINLLLDSVVRPSGWTGTGSGAYIKVGFGQMPQ